ncbi:hypothetical protein Cgig2_018237 [Carnegiea gigantea]|uniref:Fe2OG dioxygenase domain-containing protein n=1 Tax=Carnegiea gigantea TaxID=171969 RepID=A0A9Q1QQJ6_9CARY|nr:hypothetical protein Cgig2_018237 [Carnegiea gigantea]
MQHDEVIWQVIRHNHCSYMSKIDTGKFCRNPYNVTGICNRSSCPLANSRYATIRDHEGVFYLYMKTIERAHMPNKLWERVKLPRNYEKALEIIDKHLSDGLDRRDCGEQPTYLGGRFGRRRGDFLLICLALYEWEKIMTTPRKEKKRDARRLEKAEKAALIDKKIEEELLERLKRGVYEDIYNFNEKAFNQVLEGHEVEEELEEEEPEVEYVEGYEELEEEDDIEDFGNFTIDVGEAGLDDDDEDDVGVAERKRTRGESLRALKKIEKEEPVPKSKKKARVLVEVEHEDAGDRQTAVQSLKVVILFSPSSIQKFRPQLFTGKPHCLLNLKQKTSCSQRKSGQIHQRHAHNHELCRRMLDAVTEFFLLPPEKKAAYFSEDPRTPVRVTNRQLKFEGQENTVTMWNENLFHPWHPTLKEAMVEYAKEIGVLMTRLLSLISQGLGLEEGYLEKRVGPNPRHKALANYYPPSPHPELTLGLDAHTDVPLLTILLQSDGVTGLQVMKDDKWAPVDPIPDSFVINLGDQMQVIIRLK